MNLRLIAKLLGALLMLQSFFVGICWIFSLIDAPSTDFGQSSKGLLYSFFIGLALGRFLLYLGYENQKIHSLKDWLVVRFLGFSSSAEITKREGIAIVGLGWIVAGIYGALPYILSEPALSIPDAVFESISGFTTTGSTIMADIEIFPRSTLLWRAMTQWLGGVGILVLFVALLSSIGVGGKTLFNNESSFQRMDSLFGRSHEMALTLMYTYIALTLVCFTGLKVLGMTWYDAITHTLTTVSTGGFSPHNESISFVSNWKTAEAIQLWISLFMVICSINFLIVIILTYGVYKDRKVITANFIQWLRKVFRPKSPLNENQKHHRYSRYWKRLANEGEAVWYLIIVFFATFFFILGISIHADFSNNFWKTFCESVFMVASISSTTGFGLSDYSQWPVFSKVILVFLMLIGGCAGATAGGMKIGRFKTCLKMGIHEIVKTFRPNVVSKITLNGNPIPDDTRRGIAVFFILYFTIILIGAFIFSLLELGKGYDMETIFGAILATFPNIGPGFGSLGPMDNFSILRDTSKVFLSLLMILGRLELFAIMIFFSPSFWKRY